MKTFTIKRTEECKKNYINLDILITICAVLALWKILSMFHSPIILPGPGLTLKSFISILQERRFLTEVLVTLNRFFGGVFLSVIVGSVLGFFIGINQRTKNILEPLVYLLQSIPPILFMTLAMIWFGLDGQATIFIIFIVSIPIISINIREGLDNIDLRLVEMGNTFRFSRKKMILKVIIPSVKPYFKSGFFVVVGLGWKLVIMGEVLCASTGLGAQITDARLNLETDKVFAWSIVVILICFLSQKTIDIVSDFSLSRRKKYVVEDE